MKPIESPWYAVTAAPAPRRPALAGDLDADVCVVGGGVAGCSTALHLAERGFDVVLLEESAIGHGASGRSGGQLLPGYSCGQDKLARLLGPPDARRLWDWSVEGLALARDRIARHAIVCDLQAGHLQVAVRPRQLDAVAQEQAQLESWGYVGTRLLDRDALRTIVASPRYLGGLYDPHAAHVHPLNYTLGLARAAEAAGARLREGSRVLAVEPGPTPGARATVKTAQGRVRARWVALCGNAKLGSAAPTIRRRIMPIATYMVATAPLGPALARELIANRAAVADLNWVLDYFRLSHDDRLLFGGKVSYSGYDPGGIVPGMRRRLDRVFPQLAKVPLDYAWGGLLDITVNRAPDFGRLAPNVYYLQGFSGHGLVLAGLGGRLVAEAVAGHAERFDVYARIAHRPFPGGRLFARPTLVAAMAWFRLRDALA